MGRRGRLLRLDLSPPPSTPPPKVPIPSSSTGHVAVSNPEADCDSLACLAAVIYREVWIEIRDIWRDRLAAERDKSKKGDSKSMSLKMSPEMWHPRSSSQLQ